REEEVRRKLTPDYLIGCKRLAISDDFYPAFNRPDVALVTAPIRAVEPTGIRTADGTLHEVDHIVFATGFTVADFAGHLRVVGRDGQVLTEVWASAPEAYLGITISGFPNLAMLLGPNSALGHSSQLHIIESQVDYVIQYIDALRARDGIVLDVLPAIQQDYNRAIQARLANTVWATGCNSWYLNRSGRNTTVFPGLARHYRKLTARFDVASYARERVGRHVIPAERPSAREPGSM